MSRRTGRKPAITPSYNEIDDEIPYPPALKRTPTKKRTVSAANQTLKEVENGTIPIDSKSSPTSAVKTKKTPSNSQENPGVPDTLKISRENGVAAPTKQSAEKPKGPGGKRQKVEVDENSDGEIEGKKDKKKRKTKEEKESEAMPLAARTAVGSLKKAMYIGAHVSGAGGTLRSVP